MEEVAGFLLNQVSGLGPTEMSCPLVSVILSTTECYLGLDDPSVFVVLRKDSSLGCSGHESSKSQNSKIWVPKEELLDEV